MSFQGIQENQGSYFSQINDPEARANIEKLAKQCSATPDAVLVMLFSLMTIAKQDKAPVTPLASERVKVDLELERLADELMMETASERQIPKMRATSSKVSAVATLVTPPRDIELERLADELMLETNRPTLYDPRLNLSDFTRLEESNALSAINFLCHTKRGVSSKQLQGMYQFFTQEPKRFNKLLELGSPNQQFDLFLMAAEDDLQQRSPTLNQFVVFKESFFEFAFSEQRFEWVQIQNNEISSTLISEMLEFEAKIKSETLIEDLESFKQEKGDLYRKWIELNTAGSSSLKKSEALERWLAADARKTTYAKNGSFELFHINLIHRDLTRGEEGIQKPGVFRSGTVRIGGAGATALPPPGSKVLSMMNAYENWLMKELAMCSEGKKSIILTSAQAYQRLVALHPFENGNGRVSRLVMNQVLEKMGIPPSVLGNDVLDAVFTLQPKKPRHEGEAFVRKVFQGVKQSAELIYGSKI
ncbi:Fic family protein [Estrella lausannensis]|uniref:Fido domain-containing protein n=1 Tax=Estrella lausannensis TaxID=483423 RepID=A0A0H5DNC4_9BACT|nr:Fic family protein [Estrella lausannensis]CRX37662.1 hypothetical protein ELAC_0301 [Estrella lausannensis]